MHRNNDQETGRREGFLTLKHECPPWRRPPPCPNNPTDCGRWPPTGTSPGGCPSLSVAAVLGRPDVFHAAVAGAGVTDQRLYDAHWRERFLGHPDAFPRRYAVCSLVRDAPRLTRPLLLVHGLADTKAPPVNTELLSRAPRAAGCPHEVLLVPGVGHQPMGTAVTDSLLRRHVRFFPRHLKCSGRA